MLHVSPENHLQHQAPDLDTGLEIEECQNTCLRNLFSVKVSKKAI